MFEKLSWLLIPSLLMPLASLNLVAIAQPKPATTPATAPNTALTIRADTQEANSKTGVVTATGNVHMNYPARQIVATSAQAQYFSKERRIILTGNVVVTQQGNRIVAETITYLIDVGKFEAKPEANRQVESIYIVPDENPTVPAAASTTPVKQVKPAFKNQVSPAIALPKSPEKSPEKTADPLPKS
jgi:lipopolysaccharide export system protein LptA